MNCINETSPPENISTDMFLATNDHCSMLVDILEQTESYMDWFNISEWLVLAASIKSMEINTIQFDDGFGMCAQSDEYSTSREILLNDYIKALSKFNFIWGALESTISHIAPPKHPEKSKRGKIRDACYFFNNVLEVKQFPPLLIEETRKFRTSALHCCGNQKVEDRFKKANEIGRYGIGLFSVYELRNSFAHGSMAFPEPDEDNKPFSHHLTMLTHATRIVLISIQCLLLTHFKEPEQFIPLKIRGRYLENYSLIEALKSCHLAKIIQNQYQWPLF